MSFRRQQWHFGRCGVFFDQNQSFKLEFSVAFTIKLTALKGSATPQLPFFKKTFGLLFAVSNVVTVITIAASMNTWATAEIPNTHILPIHNENMTHHIQASNCLIQCRTFSSRICLRGLWLEFITPFHDLYTNFFMNFSFSTKVVIFRRNLLMLLFKITFHTLT